MFDDHCPDHNTQSRPGSTSAEKGDASDLKDPSKRDAELAALLCAALDGAATDPVRLDLMTRLFFLTQDTGRDADLDIMRRDGPPTVYVMA